MGGWIRVTVTVTDGEITEAVVEQQGETVGIGGYEAIEDGSYATQILAAQGTGIDGISGATITTTAVKDALAAALKQAA